MVFMVISLRTHPVSTLARASSVRWVPLAELVAERVFSNSSSRLIISSFISSASQDCEADRTPMVSSV
jgi:hypothetical protein